MRPDFENTYDVTIMINAAKGDGNAARALLTKTLKKAKIPYAPRRDYMAGYYESGVYHDPRAHVPMTGPEYQRFIRIVSGLSWDPFDIYADSMPDRYID